MMSGSLRPRTVDDFEATSSGTAEATDTWGGLPSLPVSFGLISNASFSSSTDSLEAQLVTTCQGS